jgi:hypothetical protein
MLWGDRLLRAMMLMIARSEMREAKKLEGQALEMECRAVRLRDRANAVFDFYDVDEEGD